MGGGTRGGGCGSYSLSDKGWRIYNLVEKFTHMSEDEVGDDVLDAIEALLEGRLDCVHCEDYEQPKPGENGGTCGWTGEATVPDWFCKHQVVSKRWREVLGQLGGQG